jgi:SAM-dependent methyltransferase
MSDLSRQDHWELVYRTKSEKEVSWFQEEAEPSVELILNAGATPTSAIIDIGGGASRLVDALVSRGFTRVTVLDLSGAALSTACARLGSAAGQAEWIVADVTRWEPAQVYDLWHDRAAFHFLADSADRAAYVQRVRRAVRPGGHLIIGSFALDGPERCSGLPVARYDGAGLAAEFGNAFELISTRLHLHETPWGAQQRFQFSTFRAVKG